MAHYIPLLLFKIFQRLPCFQEEVKIPFTVDKTHMPGSHLSLASLLSPTGEEHAHCPLATHISLDSSPGYVPTDPGAVTFPFARHAFPPLFVRLTNINLLDLNSFF